MQNQYHSEHVITTKHYLVLCTAFYVSGIFCAAQYDIHRSLLISVWLFVFLSLLSVCICILKNYKSPVLKVNKYIIMPLLLTVFFLTGVGRIYLSQQASEKSLRGYINESVWLYGTVNTSPKLTSTGYSYSFEMSVRGISKNNILYPAKEKIIIYISSSKYKGLKISDSINCWTSISYPDTKKPEDIFDYHTYLKGKNIFVIGNTQNINTATDTDSILQPNITDILSLKLNETGSLLRSKITYAADRLFSYNAEANTILNGILVGDKSDFSDRLYKQFSNSGISHIVAVSGMHLSMLFAALNFLFSAAYLHRKTAFILAVPCLVVFVSTAGFAPSVCRAALMLLLMITAALISERYNSVTALFFALGIIVSAAPYSLFSPGLVLSFGATFGILVYAKYFKAIFNRLTLFKTVLSPVSDSLALSLSSCIGTAYFTMLFFNRFSLIQALTNLWVIPVVSVIFCGGYICCLLYYFLPEAVMKIICYPVSGALRIVVETSNFFGKDCFSLNASPNTLSPLLPFTYTGIAICLYLLCKDIADSAHNKN